MCMCEAISFLIILMLHHQSLLHFSFNSFAILPLFYPFHPPAALPWAFFLTVLSLLDAILFILALGCNCSFVVIVSLIVCIIIVLCCCCQEQVVDETCKGSVFCVHERDVIRTCSWCSFDPDKDTPPGGTLLKK